jgi:hypothetical protein
LFGLDHARAVVDLVRDVGGLCRYAADLADEGNLSIRTRCQFKLL